MDARKAEKSGAAAPVRKEKSSLMQTSGHTNNNSPQYQHPAEIQHSSSNPHIHGNKKDSSAKKDKNASRHSYHQGANGNAAPGKSAPNSSVASGKNAANGSAAPGRNSSNHNDFTAKRGAVTRERSFMRPHSQAFHNTLAGPQQEQAGGGHTSRGAATVQRQRSCVANLYGSHGRSQSSVAMPAVTACPRPKPAMQLYRPPTLRVSDDYTMSNGSYAYETCNGSSPEHPHQGNGSTNGHAGNGSLFKPGLNINAKEFVSLSTNGFNGGGVSFSGPNGMTAAALKHSKSSSQVGGSRSPKGSWLGNASSKSGGIATPVKEGRYSTGGGMAGAPGSSPPLRVHFTDDTITYDPDTKVGMIQRSPTTSNYLLATTSPAIIPIKRSKSLGSAADLALQSSNGGTSLYCSPGDTTNSAGTNAITDMAPFSDDVTKKLQQVLQSPDSATARVVMEAVRQLFNKLLQGTRYAEPAARYCIAVIEKESSGETFLDTLLNTCQEYYQERERLLRPPPPTPTRSSAPPATHTRWVAYMTFLHEMYTQVKRRQRTVVSATAPGMLLLTLLAECCIVSLEDQAAGGASMAQTECLFFILTGVGKDIELELPPHMSRVMGAARDALFASARVPAVRKTLLQLIEMNAASWQLPAPAVMYYYPGAGGK